MPLLYLHNRLPFRMEPMDHFLLTLRIGERRANEHCMNGCYNMQGGGSSPVNQPPVVNAGADQTITLPANSVNLSILASDADGSVSGV